MFSRTAVKLYVGSSALIIEGRTMQHIKEVVLSVEPRVTREAIEIKVEPA